jgi:Fe-S cluster assembly iron-binding protein IscA
MDGITNRASYTRKWFLDGVKAPPDTAVRYRVANGGPKMKLDTRDSADLTFEDDGRTVLVVDTISAEIVAGRKLDHTDYAFRQV